MQSKIFFFLLLPALVACRPDQVFIIDGKPLLQSLIAEKRGAPEPSESVLVAAGAHTITLPVNISGSKIEWTGTKITGYHQGIVRIASGNILIENKMLKGGNFTIDMQTIENTDIPDSDPIPKRKLVAHLKSEDFFDVKKYPTATFNIQQAVPKKKNSNLYTISGHLTMHGKTNPVTFEADISNLTDSFFLGQASCSINRQDWGVAYKGLRDQLVHDQVQLRIILVAKADK